MCWWLENFSSVKEANILWQICLLLFLGNDLVMLVMEGVVVVVVLQ